VTDCLFCKIANKEIPSNIVYENEKILVFKDINPEAPVHILIIPKVHMDSALELDESNSNIISHIFAIIPKLAKELGVDEKGFRVVTNIGEYGGQTVKHLHFHMLGGRNLSWPPG